MKKLNVRISYSPDRFSRACGCMIPGGYVAELVEPLDGAHYYSGRADSADEAMNDLGEQVGASLTCVLSDSEGWLTV